MPDREGYWPSIGSTVSKLQGPSAPGLPPFVGLTPTPKNAFWGDVGIPGFLGPAHAAFHPLGREREDMILNVSLERLRERRGLVENLNASADSWSPTPPCRPSTAFSSRPSACSPRASSSGPATSREKIRRCLSATDEARYILWLFEISCGWIWRLHGPRCGVESSVRPSGGRSRAFVGGCQRGFGNLRPRGRRAGSRLRLKAAESRNAQHSRYLSPEKDVAATHTKAIRADFIGDGPPLYNEHLLVARRLVEAGVRCVTLSFGRWDTHANSVDVISNFESLRRFLPELDKAVTALVQDIHDRGMDKDVSVVVWGEFGRTPIITTRRADATTGRESPAPGWPAAACALAR